MVRTKKPAVKTPRYTAKFLAAGTFLESASKMLTFKSVLPKEYSPLGFWLGRAEGELASLDFSAAGAASAEAAFALSDLGRRTGRGRGAVGLGFGAATDWAVFSGRGAG